MSTTTFKDQKPASASRRRSSRACLSCRARKVRCDVTHKGRPCTNCGLDKKQCVVTRRSNYNPLTPIRNDTQVLTPPTPNSSNPVPVIDELNTSTPMTPELRTPFSSMPQRFSASIDVTFLHCRFLSVSNIHNMPPADLNYIESQGCLRVPERPVLDLLVQQYFRYVHPVLPLIDEADFWDMYYQQSSETPSLQVPVVLLQAMLFTACSYAPKEVIQALRFSTTKEARSGLYRKAKLLYDFESESSLVTRTQTSLLLAYWSPQFSSGPKKQNLSWLNEAIQNATSLEAHVQASLPAVTRKTHFAQWKRQNLLKRLWWCCIICDRILPLNMRRSLQISRAHFGCDTNPILGYADLSNEIGRSQVYHAETKRRLTDVVEQTAELCAALTNIIELVYPLDDVPACQSRQRLEREAGQINDCRAAMTAWFNRARSLFPDSGGRRDSQMVPGSDGSVGEDPVRLFTNLMFMHYQTARLALCNHEILLQLACSSVSPTPGNSMSNVSTLHDLRLEVQQTTAGLSDCLEDLSQLGLVQKLPISGVSYFALPLLLSLVDMKLASRGERAGMPKPDSTHTTGQQKTLNSLLRVLRILEVQFPEDCDYIIKASCGMMDSIHNEIGSNRGVMNTSLSPSQQANHERESLACGWPDILECQPGSYARLIIAMDLSLSQRTLPREVAFSTSLHHLRYSEAMDSFRQFSMGQEDTSIPTPMQSSHGTGHSPSSLLTGSNLSPAHLENDVNILYDSTSSVSQDEQYSTSLMAIENMMGRVPPTPQPSLATLPSPSTNQHQPARDDWSQILAFADNGISARNDDWFERMLLEESMMEDSPSDTRAVHATAATEA